MTPEINALIERSDDVIGGFWGNHIKWFTDDFSGMAEPGFTATVYGHKPFNQMPKVGHLIAAEMQRSWMLFEVLTVDRKSNPPDMFFASVKPVEQAAKP